MIFLELKQKQIKKKTLSHSRVLGYKRNPNSKSELDPSLSSYSARTGDLAPGDAFRGSEARLYSVA